MSNWTRLSAGALAAIVSASVHAAEAPAPDQVNFDEYGAVADPLTVRSGDAEQGREVYAQRSLGNCVACHQVGALPDVPFQGTVGPALDGVADRWSEADLRGIVANAKQVFPGTIMPAFYKNSGYVRPGDGFTGDAASEPLDPLLSAQQVEDVVAFLMTLKAE